MFKTLSAAVIAASMLAAPVFAASPIKNGMQNTPVVQTKPAATGQLSASKPSVMNAKAAMTRHHVKHRHHMRHRMHRKFSASKFHKLSRAHVQGKHAAIVRPVATKRG